MCIYIYIYCIYVYRCTHYIHRMSLSGPSSANITGAIDCALQIELHKNNTHQSLTSDLELAIFTVIVF